MMRREVELIASDLKNPKIIKYKNKIYIASENKALMEYKDGKLFEVRLKHNTEQ